jgi:ADP-ribose pyrophosphatase YjhB (NUDIX family)
MKAQEAQTATQPHGSWKDETGRTLADYPRPSVAVDTAVLTVGPRERHEGGRPEGGRPDLQLKVLLVASTGGGGESGWALPGTFLHEGETLREAVARSLRDKVGFRGRLVTTQLEVFDDPARDPRGWVLSVGHVAVVPFERVERLVVRSGDRVRLVPVSRPGPLPYDHADIVKEARRVLRRRYAREPDPFHLLGGSFTMTELRQVHEAIAGTMLQRDTFRRAMEPRLGPTDQRSVGRAGRPSLIYART